MQELSIQEISNKEVQILLVVSLLRLLSAQVRIIRIQNSELRVKS